jgi:hypothetical protein
LNSSAVPLRPFANAELGQVTAAALIAPQQTHPSMRDGSEFSAKAKSAWSILYRQRPAEL